MRLVSYISSGRPSWGCLDGEHHVVDVPALGRGYPASVADLVTSPRRAEVLHELEALPESAKRRTELASLTLTEPLQARRNVFAVGVNYRAHIAEAAATPPSEPVIFTKASTAVTGPGDVVVDPALTERVDWEVELAVVLGAGGRYLSAEQARDAVFGYTVANDLSARDQQHGRAEGQWFLGKSLDGFCPLGPALVTADEAAPGELRLTVNGVTKQQAQVSDMIFSVEAIIVELSRFITLLPGDILLTGTPAGVGDARTPPEYLTDGDVVVAEVSGIGALANRIVHKAGGR